MLIAHIHTRGRGRAYVSAIFFRSLDSPRLITHGLLLPATRPRLAFREPAIILQYDRSFICQASSASVISVPKGWRGAFALVVLNIHPPSAEKGIWKELNGGIRFPRLSSQSPRWSHRSWRGVPANSYTFGGYSQFTHSCIETERFSPGFGFAA